MQMTESENTVFDTTAFLAKASFGRRMVRLKPNQVFFSQGSLADSVFYLQKGRARITVVSEKGKEDDPDSVTDKTPQRYAYQYCHSGK
jgi:CRP-like cAMP-binding protein